MYLCRTMKPKIEFRLLTHDELLPLQNDFVLFLAAQGITKTDWTEIQAHNPERYQALLIDFSNMVWRKILEGKECMEFVANGHRYVIHYRENETEMIRTSLQSPYEVARKVIARESEVKTAIFEALEAGAAFCQLSDFEACKLLWQGTV